jgi:glyoxylase I family protein
VTTINIGHVGLNCLDVDATERFYSRFFGFRRETELTLGDNRLVFISAGDVVFELFEAQVAASSPQDATGPTAAGFRHLALQVNDVVAVLASMEGAAELTQGPLDLTSHGLSAAVAWLRDPDGRILEIYQ